MCASTMQDGVRQSFFPTIGSVRAARQLVREVMVDPTSLRDEIELIVSELAANAVLHAATPYTVAVEGDERRLRVEVADGSPKMPYAEQGGDEHVEDVGITGHGLEIVRTLADAWGSWRTDDGKVVWAEVLLRTGDGLSPDGEG
jgi:anti-sigma regulatory factor (Ser/Thr protein kinase)